MDVEKKNMVIKLTNSIIEAIDTWYEKIDSDIKTFGSIDEINDTIKLDFLCSIFRVGNGKKANNDVVSLIQNCYGEVYTEDLIENIRKDISNADHGYAYKTLPLIMYLEYESDVSFCNLYLSALSLTLIIFLELNDKYE